MYFHTHGGPVGKPIFNQNFTKLKLITGLCNRIKNFTVARGRASLSRVGKIYRGSYLGNFTATATRIRLNLCMNGTCTFIYLGHCLFWKGSNKKKIYRTGGKSFNLLPIDWILIDEWWQHRSKSRPRLVPTPIWVGLENDQAICRYGLAKKSNGIAHDPRLVVQQLTDKGRGLGAKKKYRREYKGRG